MLTVIAYDIADNKRRTDVSGFMENYGQRVQKSMFECYVNEQQYAHIKETLETLTDLTTDNVRFYRLCKKDMDRIVSEGSTPAYRDEDYFMI